MIHLPESSINTDINECISTDLNSCAEQAACTNSDGSFICTCDIGYTGDGMTCTGIYVI